MNREGDLLPLDLVKFRKIEKVFRELTEQFGYKEIKTSTIEPFFLYTATHVLTPELLERSYSFIDWDSWRGERVVLRPDCTVSTCRYYIDYNANYPNTSIDEKFYYIQKVFRLDQDEVRSLKEVWHFGIENIGSKPPLSDVETIFIANDIIKKLNIKSCHLVLSYPKIIIECIKLVFGEDKKHEVLDIINRKKTTNITKLIKNLNKLNEHNQLFEVFTKLISYKGTNAAYLKNLLCEFDLSIEDTKQKKHLESIQNFLKKFLEICTLIDQLKCNYEIDFCLSQEFEYYTGIHFHYLSDKGNILCSGGRYDNLLSKIAEKIQVDIPAVGMAFFIKEMFNELSPDVLATEQSKEVVIIVSNLSSENIEIAQGLCSRFKMLGFRSSIVLSKIDKENIQSYGMVLDIDSNLYRNGYKILFSRDIEKSLVQNMFKDNLLNG